MTTTQTSSKEPNYHVPGLDRGLDALELLSRNRVPLTVAELTRLLDIPRSTVFRILVTLERKGYVEVDPSGKAYVLGPGILRLGYQFLASRDVAQVARADLEALARRTGISAHLVQRDKRDIVYLLHVLGNANFVSNLGVGDRLPAHATPTGQLLLSALSRPDLLALYRDVKLEVLTGQTPKTSTALATVVAAAAARGYVVSEGAVHAGGISIAAPVFGPDGQIAAAIDISGPADVFDLSQLETRYRDEVLQAARAISVRLGFKA